MKEVEIIFKDKSYNWFCKSFGEEIESVYKYESSNDNTQSSKDWISPAGDVREQGKRLYIDNKYNGRTYSYLLEEIESYKINEIDV